jgi:hypothetical protein
MAQQRAPRVDKGEVSRDQAGGAEECPAQAADGRHSALDGR